MALLRLLCFPSTCHFSPTSLSSSSLHNKHPLPLPLLSHTLPITSQRLLFFPISSSIQPQATIENPQHEQINSFEEQVEASKTRLLAQNVSWTCTAEDIRPLFEKYGTVLDVELSMHNRTRNRGLAFVTMGSHEEALAALNNLESYEFEGRALKLTWARPQKKKVSSPAQSKLVPVHNLFVANLPFQARAKDLKEFFNGENANVVSAEIIFNENPRGSAGYGFVSFYTKEEAEAALSDFQGKMFMGRPIRVARSKKFLRQETKVNMHSGNT